MFFGIGIGVGPFCFGAALVSVFVRQHWTKIRQRVRAWSFVKTRKLSFFFSAVDPFLVCLTSTGMRCVDCTRFFCFVAID